MHLRISCLLLALGTAYSVGFSADAYPSDAGQTAVVSADYLLQPYDQIQVQVFQEPDLDRLVRLSQDGRVTLPLIGTVDLKAKSVREAQAIIRAMYDRDYIVNPQINVSVLEYSKEMVSIIGAVNTPGAIPIPPDHRLSLIEAVARAGGFNRLADRRHVKLTRKATGGKTEVTVINADDLMQNGAADQWIVESGDVIFVAERLL
jgi:polysaccharide export outer membrane protein